MRPGVRPAYKTDMRQRIRYRYPNQPRPPLKHMFVLMCLGAVSFLMMVVTAVHGSGPTP